VHWIVFELQIYSRLLKKEKFILFFVRHLYVRFETKQNSRVITAFGVRRVPVQKWPVPSVTETFHGGCSPSPSQSPQFLKLKFSLSPPWNSKIIVKDVDWKSNISNYQVIAISIALHAFYVWIILCMGVFKLNLVPVHYNNMRKSFALFLWQPCLVMIWSSRSKNE
jgi:hypothetical protein